MAAGARFAAVRPRRRPPAAAGRGRCGKVLPGIAQLAGLAGHRRGGDRRAGRVRLLRDSGLYPVRRLLERTVGVQRETGGAERLRLLHADLVRRGLPAADHGCRCWPPSSASSLRSVTSPKPSDARRLNEDILKAACDYVESCLGPAPSVLIAEDVHWFDGSTLDLVMRCRASSGCAVIMTARPGFAAPARGRGHRAAATVRGAQRSTGRRPVRGFSHRCVDPPRRGRPE